MAEYALGRCPHRCPQLTPLGGARQTLALWAPSLERTLAAIRADCVDPPPAHTRTSAGRPRHGRGGEASWSAC
eukprot:4230437-Alexandrium_andersonii.AAC.1